MLTNLEWICNLKMTYRKRFRTKYLCSALVSAKTKGLKLDRINLLNYLDEGKLHFDKDGLGKIHYI